MRGTDVASATPRPNPSVVQLTTTLRKTHRRTKRWQAPKRLRLIQRRKALGYNTQEGLAEQLGCERTTE